MTNKELEKSIYKKQWIQAEDFIFYITNRYFNKKVPIKEIRVKLANNHPIIYFDIWDDLRKFTVHFMKNGRIRVNVYFVMDYHVFEFDIINDKNLSKRALSKKIYNECFMKAEKSSHSYLSCIYFSYPNFIDNYFTSKSREEIIKILVRNILNKKDIKYLVLKCKQNRLEIHITDKNREQFYNINTCLSEQVFFEKKKLNSNIRCIIEQINYSDSKLNNKLIKSKLERDIKQKTRNFINTNIKN